MKMYFPLYKAFTLKSNREASYKIIHKSKRLEMPVKEVGEGGGIKRGSHKQLLNTVIPPRPLKIVISLKINSL